MVVLLRILLLLLLMIGAGVAGGVVVHLAPGAAEVRVVQRRHEGAIVATKILELVSTGVTLNESGLRLVLLAMRAFAVGATCEILQVFRLIKHQFPSGRTVNSEGGLALYLILVATG